MPQYLQKHGKMDAYIIVVHCVYGTRALVHVCVCVYLILSTVRFKDAMFAPQSLLRPIFTGLGVMEPFPSSPDLAHPIGFVALHPDSRQPNRLHST